ncbi:MAG: hydrogenase nickel incorporation protein HypB [Rhodobacteraceae bacterium]|nr:hydrogenase nickel incorporation protein HypB [Paracoccaceae bacterium]
MHDPSSLHGSPKNAKLIEIERSILSRNDAYAELNRKWFEERGHLALNLVSSPGAGKTSLLVETIRRILGKFPVAVVEGDQETANDADQVRETGVEVVQINTGLGCHLDAHMVGHALEDLPSVNNAVIFIENVGNLVCPASFDLGEEAKVVILSTTEGDDKPLKYPDMFAASNVMVLSKTDLLPHVCFDKDKAIANALAINPELTCLEVSAKTGEGMNLWLQWIAEARATPLRNPDSPMAAIQEVVHA